MGSMGTDGLQWHGVQVMQVAQVIQGGAQIGGGIRESTIQVKKYSTTHGNRKTDS